MIDADGDAVLPDDEEGEEYVNLEAVRLQAIESARELLSEAALSGKAASLNQQIEVVDESGRKSRFRDPRSAGPLLIYVLP